MIVEFLLVEKRPHRTGVGDLHCAKELYKMDEVGQRMKGHWGKGWVESVENEKPKEDWSEGQV